MKRYLALLMLCAVMMFSGCREGGYDNTNVHRSEEFNVGERLEYSSVSSLETSVYSSSSVSSSSAESRISLLRGQDNDKRRQGVRRSVIKV